MLPKMCQKFCSTPQKQHFQGVAILFWSQMCVRVCQSVSKGSRVLFQPVQAWQGSEAFSSLPRLLPDVSNQPEAQEPCPAAQTSRGCAKWNPVSRELLQGSGAFQPPRTVPRWSPGTMELSVLCPLFVYKHCNFLQPSLFTKGISCQPSCFYNFNSFLQF